MYKEIADIVERIELTLREAMPNSIEKGCFVTSSEEEDGEWMVDDIIGEEAELSNADGAKKKSTLSSLSFASKKLENSDFSDMPMENSLDSFDDEIDAMPFDQLKDMPAMDKGMMGFDSNSMTGDADAEIDSSIYNHTIEKNPEQAGDYSNDEPEDAGYPFPSFKRR